MTKRTHTILLATAPLLLTSVLATAAHGQVASQEVAEFIKEATGVDLNAPPPAHNMSDAFNLYQLKRENLVRTDNPQIKAPFDLDQIVDPAPLIDKRDFRRRVMESDNYVPGEVYVHMKPGVDDARAAAVHARQGGQVIWTSAIVPGLCKVKVDDPVRDVVNAYLDENDVLYAEPQYRVEPTGSGYNDPQANQCWGLWDYYGTWACEAWAEGPAIGSPVVAIIDTGMQTDHTDLGVNIWLNPGDSTVDGIDNDGNGHVDDLFGWNVALNNGDVYHCGNDHGTHVAGTVGAAGNNAFGITGVAPFCKLMVLRCNGPSAECDPDGPGPNPPAFDPCCGLYNVTEATDYAIANGARVSNNSYGSYGESAAHYAAILAGQAFGHIFVASAGNGGPNQIGDDNDQLPVYPATFDLTNIISVAAHDIDGNLPTFTNYGAVTVDIGAPGVDVYSTLPNGGFGNKDGTSMAAPHVTGVVALVIGRYPNTPWQHVVSRVLDGASPTAQWNGKVATNGQVNAFRPLGVWVDPADPAVDSFGSFNYPFHRAQTQFALGDTPVHGVLNFKAGVIPQANAAFVWNKSVILRAPNGSVILGD